MIKFKIGDKVRIKKLSEKEFKEVYNEKYNNPARYFYYLKEFSEYFGRISIIKNSYHRIITLLDIDSRFFPEELEKAYSLKDKLALIRKLIK
jgi:hypothetical protein